MEIDKKCDLIRFSWRYNAEKAENFINAIYIKFSNLWKMWLIIMRGVGKRWSRRMLIWCGKETLTLQYTSLVVINEKNGFVLRTSDICAALFYQILIEILWECEAT